MATAMSTQPADQAKLAQPVPAAPPSRPEIERKLSLKSAARPPKVNVGDSPKKAKRQSQGPPSAYPTPISMSGNDSDTSSVSHTSTQPQMSSSAFSTSPIMTPGTTSSLAGGLSSIAERERIARSAVGGPSGGGGVPGGDFDEMELADVEEEGEIIEGDEGGEGEESEELEKRGGDLQRGMEGERMVKSGFLYKKQERRKAWKRKWFVLRTGKLAYYKDEKEYSLQRVLDLKSIQTVAPVTVKKHPFTFGIVTSKRTFFAKASSQDELDDWVRTINTARRKMSEREEEEHNRRVGHPTPASAPVNMPPRPERKGSTDDHMGTYTSTFTATTSSAYSPVTSTGYFPPTPASAYSTAMGGSPSLSLNTKDQGNNLTSQMAKMSIPSPTTAHPSRMPYQNQPQSRVVSNASRREPSASSFGSSYQGPAPQPDYFGSAALAPAVSGTSSWGHQTYNQPSSEDEGSFSDHQHRMTTAPAVTPGPSTGAQPSQILSGQTQVTVDPKKIILQAYLMKRSKGRGRKVWRKRWFYLTSQGLTYTKSHMDTRVLRFIPLSSVLDALEVDPEDDDSDVNSDSDAQESGYTSPPQRQMTNSRQLRRAESRMSEKPGMAENEHLFRLITAKRTFVLCAPSEEDEIKWLAAFRALLNRERERSAGGTTSPIMSPLNENAPRRFSLNPQHPHNPLAVPTITQQPPTPATTLPGGMTQGQQLQQSQQYGDGATTTPAVTTSQGPPIGTTDTAVGSQTSPGRARSATYVAKGAVADVARRYHPETAASGGTNQ